MNKRRILQAAGLITLLGASQVPYLLRESSRAAPYVAVQQETVSQGIASSDWSAAQKNRKYFRERVKSRLYEAIFLFDERFDRRPELDVYVNKTANRAAIFHGDTLLREVTVSTGQVQKTEKSRYGEYVTPDGEYLVIDHRDREDLESKFGDHAAYYGEGMLRLLGPYGGDIALHGTNKPQTLGTYETNGCVRFSNEDIRWALATVGTGSRVHIGRWSEENWQQLLSTSAPIDTTTLP